MWYNSKKNLVSMKLASDTKRWLGSSIGGKPDKLHVGSYP